MIANVIHNKESEDRWALFLQEAKAEGFEYKVWDAIMDEVPATGIAKAHKQIVQDAKDKGLSCCLIMEDDVRFTDEGAFQYFLDNIPDDYDLYLSGIYAGEIRNDNTVHSFSGLHCYIIHERFYDTFLACPDRVHIDSYCKGKGKFVVCNPFAAVQYDNLYSFNARQVVNYRHLLSHRRLYKKV